MLREPWLRILWLAAMLLSAVVVAAEDIQLDISGVSGEVRENVEASLRLNRLRTAPDLDAETIRALHDTAEAEIARALEPFGFYRPTIESELLPPESGVTEWRASYRIDPGRPVPIAVIATSMLGPGKEDPDLIKLANSFPMLEGQPFRHFDYERAKQELLAEIRTAGYLDADYDERRVEIDVAAYAANVRLRIDTGPLYAIGPITFEQSLFAEEFLERYLVLEPGEAFDTSAIAEQRRLLNRSGYFEEVLIQRGEPGVDGSSAVPLNISLTPFKANRYRGQLGWGTDTGAGLQGDWNRRYIGRHGHRFLFGGSAVQDQSRVAADLRYTIPLDPLTDERFELATRIQSRTVDFEDVELDQGGETQIVTALLSGYWHFPLPSVGEFELVGRAGLSLVGESYDVFEILFGNLPENSQEAIIDFIGDEAFDTLAPSFEAVVPSFRLTARRTDDDLFIRKGDFFDLEVLGADEAAGSNIDFWQLRLKSWNIRPVGDSGRLLLRTAVGYSDAETRNVLTADFNRMPEYYEFRAGGPRSVRGYRFEELLPASGITGGKHQLTGSIEYEHEIIPDWSVAAFVDAGNVFNDWENIDEQIGAGLGARWRSPVGVARVDLAFPLDDSEDSFQLYITVGPEF